MAMALGHSRSRRAHCGPSRCSRPPVASPISKGLAAKYCCAEMARRRREARRHAPEAPAIDKDPALETPEGRCSSRCKSGARRPMPKAMDYCVRLLVPVHVSSGARAPRTSRRQAAPTAMAPNAPRAAFRSETARPGTSASTVSPPKAATTRMTWLDGRKLYGVPLRVPTAILGGRSRPCARHSHRLRPRVIHALFRKRTGSGAASLGGRARCATSLATTGHDPSRVLARSVEPEVKEELRRRTEEAVRLGIFGAPSYVVDGEVFWGQDRAHFAVGRRFEDVLPQRGSAMPAPPGRTRSSSTGTFPPRSPTSRRRKPRRSRREPERRSNGDPCSSAASSRRSAKR